MLPSSHRPRLRQLIKVVEPRPKHCGGDCATGKSPRRNVGLFGLGQPLANQIKAEIIIREIDEQLPMELTTH
jgi:hypothetical protein